MRASRRVLRWASPFSSSTSQPWQTISNKSYIRRHGFLSESPGPRRPPAQARAFSSTRPTRFMLDGDSTIYALSTATGRAAIAVVRVSGPACASIYKSLCPNHPLPKPRYAVLRTLYDPTQPPTANTVLDAGALVLYFPSPRTATGEDILELHIHGGPAITKAVLSAIAQTHTPEQTVRYAEPGEFTRRAFMNDRLSLPQIEALGDTLSADTEQQRRLAVRGSSDALLNRYERWRQGLLYARGELEALIDFSEDQHFDESTEELVSSVATQVRALSVQIGFHIANASRGELLRNGIRVALLGAPNAGKSSLLNRVVGKEAAIVSTEQGTTRDIVDVGVDLGGWYCKLGDMAGIRAEGSGDGERVVIGAVEKEGIRRARERALESDVVIVVVSLEDTATGVRLFVEPEVLGAVNDCVEAGKCLLVAINKCDKLHTTSERGVPQSLSNTIHDIFPSVPTDRVFTISCEEAKRGASSLNTTTDPGKLQVFLRGLITTFEQIASPLGVDGDGGQYDLSYWEDSLGVTHRQSSNLQICLDHLDDFLSQASSAECPDDSSREKGLRSLDSHAESEVDIVTAAEHLRFAADMLAKITGKGESGDVEDVLGVVFEK
ncbi:unnamed protein product [Penicillium nalgiovense]|uniref:Uncharacterized protein n=1 Tax=Penicillium nalgiovense TaxID=60175 RepID=A0A1V6Z077_PENNA|nr:hypothetical protein PENNAL_c0006G08695 [Penicillium nalgiovense]CAG7936218.1 unnamed protein product [Penicillium nalgiovense]CAG7936448.1 unnamed protein product [Penicillium nalgiovense]CAG7944341.1 unnamed protein product [Penicillium nalgiovense]CAG7952683.1 unnamed protein product [Penicillium nalgiovense]